MQPEYIEFGQVMEDLHYDKGELCRPCDLSLIKTNTDKDCEFSTCLKLLLSSPHFQQYLDGEDFIANKLKIDQAPCDQLAGWASFSHEVFDKDPNVCGNYLQVCITFSPHHSVFDCTFVFQDLQRQVITT